MIAQDPNLFPTSSNALKRYHEDLEDGMLVRRSVNKDCSRSQKQGEEISHDFDNAKRTRLHRDTSSTATASKEGSSTSNECQDAVVDQLKVHEKSLHDKQQMENRNQECEQDLNHSNGNNNEAVVDEEEEEPDWAMIAGHEPAKSDVPLFLDARDRREAAEARFASALDEAHASLKQCSDALLKTAADLYNVQREKLDAMEVQIKHDFVDNEIARSQMQTKLEESASAAQAQFTQLMMRVTQIGKSMSSK